MKNASSQSSVTSTEKGALAIAAGVIVFFCVLAFVATPARAEVLKPCLAQAQQRGRHTAADLGVPLRERGVQGQRGGVEWLQRPVCMHGLTPGANQCAQPSHS